MALTVFERLRNSGGAADQSLLPQRRKNPLPSFVLTLLIDKNVGWLHKYREMARKNPRRNISRIETKGAGGKKYGGWEVRMQRRGKKTEKFFSDRAYGGKRRALAAAKTFRDELESLSRKYTVKEMARRPSKRNRSGVVGVRLHRQKDARGEYEYLYWYWVAQWTDGHGHRRTRSFSVHRHGDQEAYRLACEARRVGVSQANR